ncbi:PilZ domain-containing protein [Methylobacterium sp. WL12]|uniref:PilZ domain-containing protein n=1 Tax=Methylobacterium sp. WL12 TaxID=2603890 RepID=UPI0011CC1B74|nr:PilZ domain-containing protein [Methylobacterium sp. WL12]TXM66506.1 PilZ domain-containing protein [Methylobacterium sp. WL12]
MSDRRRIQRQVCNLSARIFVPKTSDIILCEVTDITSYGCFIKTAEHELVPPNFDLSIGMSTLPRACRIARREANGFGVEFLDPVRQEIEAILIEHAFKEELVFEALNLASEGIVSATEVRLHKAVSAMMDLIERRNATIWQHNTTNETPIGNARSSATPIPVRYSHTPLKDLLKSA